MHKILQKKKCKNLFIYAYGGAMKIGYIRVSTPKQKLEVQRESLLKYGVEKIFEEKASGRKTDRLELNNLLSILRSGDTLVVYDLSRLGRTVHQVMKLIDEFNNQNIHFISVTEQFDTSTSVGKAMISILAAFNQMQVEIQNEKIKAGISNARNKGIRLGRKPLSPKVVKLINAMRNEGYSNRDVSSQLGISVRSVINYKASKYNL